MISDPEDTYPIQDGGKFFSFLSAVLPNDTSPESSSAPSPVDPSTSESTDTTITSPTETVLLIPLSETIFVPEYMIPSFYAASSNAYQIPPTDTQLPFNLELAEITDTIRADPIAEYVQNYPLANNLQQHDPITEQQMLLTQLYDIDFVNKTKIKPATSINSFHVNQQQRLQRSQQHPTKSEYQQPFQNVNLSSNSSSTNINETNSSVDEKHILANKIGSREETVESADVQTMKAYADEDFGAFLNGAAFNFFEKANTTVVKEFLDENGKPCVAEQLQFYSKTYFRYTCEGELYQVSTISTTWKSDVTPSNGEAAEASALPSQDEMMSAAQVNSSALPADLHHFHSFYLKRKAN